LILGIGALLTGRWIVAPLQRLRAGAEQIGEGKLATRVRIDRNDEFGEVAAAFDSMAERVELLLLGEKELIANVSHELRTPLARVRVALDLAAEGDSAAARRSLQDIAVDLAELERLLDDIMTMRRMELAGATRYRQPRGAEAQRPQGVVSGFLLQRQPLAPRELCAQIAEHFSTRHPGHTLAFEIDASADREIEVDPVLLRRALANLLDNAAKHGGASTPIAVRVAGDEEALRIDVTDRGGGISAADLPHIFTPFFRTDRSRDRDSGGVGLGLALAHRIVAAHGGALTATSRLGAGTTMRLALPWLAGSPRP